jgi:hypothetical protein
MQLLRGHLFIAEAMKGPDGKVVGTFFAIPDHLVMSYRHWLINGSENIIHISVVAA